MKTFLKIAGVIFLISFVVIPIVKNMLEKSINKTLEESGYLYKSEVKDAVKIMSNQLPIKIDDNTTAKSMKYDEDKNLLYYNYEITGVSKMEMENILPEIKNEQLQTIFWNYYSNRLSFSRLLFDTKRRRISSYCRLCNDCFLDNCIIICIL